MSPRFSSKEDFYNHFKHHNVPELPPGTAGLLKTLGDDNADFKEISLGIEHFPSIALRIIALANSAWSSPVQQVTSLETACSRLGLKIIKSVSIALAVSSSFDPTHCPAFKAQFFWARALTVAEVSQMLCELYKAEQAVDVSSVRTCGLLHNLGLLLLVQNFPDMLNQALLSYQHDKTTTINENIRQVVGFSPADAGHYLASVWKLPESIKACMSYYDQPDYRGTDWPLVNTVSLASQLVSTSHEDVETAMHLNYTAELYKHDLNTDELLTRVRQTASNMEELARTVFN